MSGESQYLLTSTGDLWNAVGDKIRGDGWYGNVSGLHTISISVDDFQGRVFVEAALASDPQDDDWFPINFTNKKVFDDPCHRHDNNIDQNFYLQFPINPNAPTGLNGGDRGISTFSFYGNYTWLRARVDRSYISVTPPQWDAIPYYGQVNKILINQ